MGRQFLSNRMRIGFFCVKTETALKTDIAPEIHSVIILFPTQVYEWLLVLFIGLEAFVFTIWTFHDFASVLIPPI